MKNKIALWLPVMVWAGGIFYLSSIPGLRITEAWWDIIARKLAHMAVFGILALLIRQALKGSTAWSNRHVTLGSLMLTFLYACSDEIHQHFVSQRHGTPIDVLIDTLGAWIALRIIRRGTFD